MPNGGEITPPSSMPHRGESPAASGSVPYPGLLTLCSPQCRKGLSTSLSLGLSSVHSFLEQSDMDRLCTPADSGTTVLYNR